MKLLLYYIFGYIVKCINKRRTLITTNHSIGVRRVTWRNPWDQSILSHKDYR